MSLNGGDKLMDWTFDPNLFAMLVVTIIPFFLRTIAPWIRKRRENGGKLAFDYEYGFTGILAWLIGILFAGTLLSVEGINVIEWAFTTIIIQLTANEMFNRYIEP